MNFNQNASFDGTNDALTFGHNLGITGDVEVNLFGVINKSANEWSKPALLANTLNTPKYIESTASITPDGKVIYFASDCVGGQGGMDIYRIDKNTDGTW